jgi:hypothetical protein
MMNAKSQATLLIHRGADRPGQYVWSPFVTKVEFRHRLSNLPYACGAAGPFAGPKGKIPWIEVSVAGQEKEVLADSSLITKYLVGKGLLGDLNAHLSAGEKGHDVAVRAMLEDKLFFYNTRERWIDNYYTMRDYSLAKAPFPQRTLFGYLSYRGIVRRLQDQGTGRFSDEEIRFFRQEIWESVNSFLEDSRKGARSGECFWVLGGEKPTEADSTVYGFIVSTLVADASPESKRIVQAFPAVVDYATRIHGQYFPDYEVWV